MVLWAKFKLSSWYRFNLRVSFTFTCINVKVESSLRKTHSWVRMLLRLLFNDFNLCSSVDRIATWPISRSFHFVVRAPDKTPKNTGPKNYAKMISVGDVVHFRFCFRNKPSQIIPSNTALWRLFIPKHRIFLFLLQMGNQEVLAPTREVNRSQHSSSTLQHGGNNSLWASKRCTIIC